MSAALASVWAKSLPRDAAPTHHLPLVQHCEDAGAVAGRLWDAWLPAAVRARFVEHLGEDARTVVQWLAASHDVGKLSPAFAWQVGALSEDMRAAGLPFPGAAWDGMGARRAAPHNVVSHAAISSWLERSHAWPRAAAASVAVVAGGHHGRQPSAGAVGSLTDENVGRGSWDSTRDELLDHLANLYGVDRWLATPCPLPQPLQVLATAIVVVADWVSSDHHRFPLVPFGTGLDGIAPTEVRLEAAWRRLGLPGPWRPTGTDDDADTLLHARFVVPEGSSARPVQVAALEVARTMPAPGLMIVEAPTGEGKTEAALLAAEVLAARFGLGGVAVHLPSTATSDAMFERVLDWLDTLPDAGEDDHVRSLGLLHGRAHLNATYRDLEEVASPGLRTYDDEAESRSAVQVVIDAWLRGRHRGALADFTVGTIDQLLFVALRSKFLPLRHLGVARKVVVLDEVHAADASMSVFLRRALAWCGAHGVPVVALSATLPSAQRRKLHDAYASGVTTPATTVHAARPRPAWKRAQTPGATVVPAVDLTYPVITSSTGGTVTSTPVAASPRRATTHVEVAGDDDETLVHLLGGALVDGGCVLVVRNTVSRAQATYALLRERFGDDVHLMHSRFLGPHRAANDAWLRTRFGPDGSRRPERAIVVATQVAEQSLDIDLDLLVTDLAPVDLLLQRIGRVHRHPRRRPPSLAEARCVVVGVEDRGDEAPRPVRGSVMIYGRHLLLRTAAVLRGLVAGPGTITAPDDVAGLVEAVYGDGPLGPPPWRAAMSDAAAKDAESLRKRESRAHAHLLEAPGKDAQPIYDWVGVAVPTGTDERGAATVRDGEDAIEVVAVRRVGGTLRLLEGIDGCDEVLPELGAFLPDDVALRIAACTVRLPGHLGVGEKADELLDALERSGYVEAWQHHPHLKGRLALVLDEHQRATLAGLQFSYDARTGLKCEEA